MTLLPKSYQGGSAVQDVYRRFGIGSPGDEDPAVSAVVANNMTQYGTVGNSIAHDDLWDKDFKDTPVSPRVFFQDEYFLGTRGQYLFKVWLDELDHVLDPTNGIREWVLTGAIGQGKSTVAVFATLYRLYYMLCLRDIHDYYTIMPGTMVVIMFFGLTLTKTDMTLWHIFEDAITHSPYFKEQGFQKERSLVDLKVDFPSHIRAVTGSQAQHAMSLNVIGGILDEQEFKKAKYQATYGEGSKPYDIYRVTRRRIASRFPDIGPGLLCNVSSAGSKTGYMTRHIEAVAGDPRSYVSSFSRYEVQPDRFTSGTFRVEIGDVIHPSRILKEAEKPRLGARVEVVPSEFEEDFRRNVEESLMDISGIPTQGQSKLISNRQDIWQCINRARKSPMTQETILSGIQSNVSLAHCLLPDLISTKRGARGKGRVPRINPQAVRFCHVDLAETDDAAGLVIAHHGGFRVFSRFDSETLVEVVVQHPLVVVDLALEIKAIPGDRIDIADIQSFLFTLRQVHGFRFTRFTSDQWGSVQIRQAFEKAGVENKILSVDKTDLPYIALRDALSYGCVDMYEYPPLIENLSDVEHDRDKRKVDHTELGKKDVSDCLASVTFQIIERYPIDLSMTLEEHAKVAAQTASLVQSPASQVEHPASGDHSWLTRGDHPPMKRDPGTFFDGKE